MCAVAPAPEANRAFEGAGTAEAEEDLEGERCGESAMRPEPVVAGGDAYAGP